MTLIADGDIELWDPASGYAFEITEGGPSAHPSVLGEDTIIPGTSGRSFGVFRDDVMAVTLYGIVMGAGVGTSAAESYHVRMQDLKEVFDPENDPFPLVVSGGMYGLSGSFTLNVRFLRFVTLAFGPHFRLMNIECESVASPPRWSAVSGGS